MESLDIIPEQSECDERNLPKIKIPKIKITHPGIEKNEFLNLISGKNEKTWKLQAKLLEIIRENEDDLEIITQICNELNNFSPLEFGDLLWLYKTSCAVLLYSCSPELITLKLDLINRTFRITSNDWDINPGHIHVICKDLMNCLKNNQNLVFFIRTISVISRATFYISLCLAWSFIMELLNQKIKMYRLYEFKALVDILEDIDLESMEDQTDRLYSILECISFICNSLQLYNSVKSKSIRCEPFTTYFSFLQNDISRLIKWCNKIEKKFDIILGMGNADSILITEIIHFNLLPMLKRTIGENDE